MTAIDLDILLNKLFEQLLKEEHTIGFEFRFVELEI
ncbi:unnamed protein product [Schistosoma mattheei]|uniref:Uncharacterized protein n=1 Tax=Schistosoma mattheei TaxID=31246 RepID=A0A3P8G6Y1_9TREM|nr:unnamed protein product [Schistosoma mattheei]